MGLTMKTFGELTQDDVTSDRQIAKEAVRILWTDDFYDGPISGIAEWTGKRYRFKLTDRNVIGSGEDLSRRYWLIALSQQQLRVEEYWQDLFCTHVQTGFDYTGRPKYRAPSSEYHKFYEPYVARAVPDYSRNEVVGWVQMY